MRTQDSAGCNTRSQAARSQYALVAVIAAIALTTITTPSAAVGRIDRPGVYSLGVWGQYGLVEGKSRYGLDFDKGAGYSLHFRYNTGRKTAFTIYFDNQTYGAKADSLENVRFTMVHGGLRLFSIPNGDVLRYLELTIGFYRPEIRYPKTQTGIGQDVSFPSSGLMGHAGGGIEIFFTQSWALELGLHGYVMQGRGLSSADIYNGEQDITFTGQGAVGLTYYLLR